MMECPRCLDERCSVIKTVHIKGVITRTRVCLNCHKVWITEEKSKSVFIFSRRTIQSQSELFENYDAEKDIERGQ